MATDEQRLGIGNTFRRPSPDLEPAAGQVYALVRRGELRSLNMGGRGQW